MADEPMTDERLAEIRARLEALNPGAWTYDAGFTSHIWNGTEIIAADVTERNAPFLVHAPEDMRALLAEVERLRTENQRLAEERERWAITATNGYETVADRSAKLAAAMAIVRYVVERENATVQMLGLNRGVACGYCHQWLNNEYQQHAPDCIMIKARALLAGE